MSGSSGFSWRVDGEIVDIIFSLCRNGQWIDEDDENEYYYVHHFYSDIEFNYLNHKIIVTANEINEYWDVDDAAMLIESLNLPGSVYVPHLLRNRTIEEFENSFKNCYWTVDGEEQEINIIFSQCRNAQWLNLDASPKFEFIKKYYSGKDEPEPPFEFCKRQTEYDYTELWDAECDFKSGIEFTYCNQRIVMPPEELQSNALFSASLIQGLKLPYNFPDKLKQFSRQDWDLDYFEGVLVNGEEVDIPFSECINVQWTDLSVEPKCEFVGKFFEVDEADEDDDDSYYYLFNSGLEFTYLDHNIVMSSDDLEDLDVNTASMLLQVLNLDAS